MLENVLILSNPKNEAFENWQGVSIQCFLECSPTVVAVFYLTLQKQDEMR